MENKNKNIFKIVCICLLVIITLGEIFVTCVPYINKKDNKTVINNTEDKKTTIDNNENEQIEEDIIDEEEIDEQEEEPKITKEYLEKNGYEKVKLNTGKYIKPIESEKPKLANILGDGKTIEYESLIISKIKFQDKNLYIDGEKILQNVNKIEYLDCIGCRHWIQIYAFKDDGIYYNEYGSNQKKFPVFLKIADNSEYNDISAYWLSRTCGADTIIFYKTNNDEYISIDKNNKLNFDIEKIYIDYESDMFVDIFGYLYYNNVKNDIRINAIFEDFSEGWFDAFITSDNILLYDLYSNRDKEDLVGNGKKISSIYYTDEYSTYIVVFKDDTYASFSHSKLVDLKE